MKRIYSKLLCGLFLSVAFASGMSAEETKAVVVISNDGTQREELIGNVDRIEIGATSLTIKTIGGDNQTLEYKDIDKILIGSEYNAVEKITAPGEIAVWPTVVTDNVNISGLSEGENVSIVSLNGAASVKAQCGEGVNSINMSHLPEGVYILSVRKQSIKLIKK